MHFRFDAGLSGSGLDGKGCLTITGGIGGQHRRNHIAGVEFVAPNRGGILIRAFQNKMDLVLLIGLEVLNGKAALACTAVTNLAGLIPIGRGVIGWAHDILGGGGSDTLLLPLTGLR